MTRTDPERWAKMFGGTPVALEFCRQHVPRLEAMADRAGLNGPAWTSAIRSGLWRFWRERWRDDRAKLEEAQRRLERRGKRNPTQDLAGALRAAFNLDSNGRPMT